jgi:MFS family permease
VTTATLVRAPGVLRTLALALLARIPLGAVGLLLVLQVRHLGHSYALAGACSGACALGMAFGAPMLGRTVDRIGQAPVLLLSGAAVMATSAAFALLPAGAPSAVFLVIAAAVGIVQPPVAACVRVLWRRMLDAPAFSALVTLDASMQELAFMLGPLLLVTVASLLGAAGALIVTGLMLGATSVVVAVLPETQRLGGADPGAADVPRGLRSGPLTSPGVRTLLAIALLMGIAFGATEIGVITVADHLGESDMAGVLFAMWGVGSFGGGLAWARHAVSRDHVNAILVLLLVLGVTSAALAVMPGVWSLGLGLVVAGAAVAPLFGVLYAAMSQVAPEASITEAFTWETSAITGGIAIGSAVAGAMAAGVSPQSTFLLGGAAFLAGAIAVRTQRATLR